MPYAVVLVSLDAAPDLRVVGNLLDVPVDEVAIGMPVEATWEERTAEDGDDGAAAAVAASATPAGEDAMTMRR